VSKGGVLLLNAAPNELGEIPIGQANVLRRLGQWLKVNGDAIYDADPSPVRNPDLPITHKPGRLFFHVKEQVEGRDFFSVDIGMVQFDEPGNYKLQLMMLDGARAIKGASKDRSGYHREFSLQSVELHLDK